MTFEYEDLENGTTLVERDGKFFGYVTPEMADKQIKKIKEGLSEWEEIKKYFGNSKSTSKEEPKEELEEE